MLIVINIQHRIHAWGTDLTEAFEQAAMGMYGYMTEINLVDNLSSEEIRAEGHDMISFLYSFLDEFLFIFNAEPNFIARVSQELPFSTFFKSFF